MIRNLLFTLCFFLSSQVLAQRAINQGERVPEDGVFFTNAQAAEIIAERQAERERLELELESEIEELETVCEAEKRKRDLYLKMEKERSDLISELKNEQIEVLYEELEKESDDYGMLWFAGGVTVGAVTSVAIFFAATQVQKMPSLISGN